MELGTRKFLDEVYSAHPSNAWRLVDESRSLIEKWARAKGLSAEDAADVAQETVAAFWRTWESRKYDERRSLRKWLSGIASRTIANHRRRLSQGPSRVDLRTDSWRLLSDGQASDELVMAMAKKEELGRVLRKVRGHVTPKTFRAFELSVLQEIPVAEVAQALGMAPKAVRLASLRVKWRIDKLMEESG